MMKREYVSIVINGWSFRIYPLMTHSMKSHVRGVNGINFRIPATRKEIPIRLREKIGAADNSAKQKRRRNDE